MSNPASISSVPSETKWCILWMIVIYNVLSIEWNITIAPALYLSHAVRKRCLVLSPFGLLHLWICIVPHQSVHLIGLAGFEKRSICVWRQLLLFDQASEIQKTIAAGRLRRILRAKTSSNKPVYNQGTTLFIWITFSHAKRGVLWMILAITVSSWTWWTAPVLNGLWDDCQRWWSL